MTDYSLNGEELDFIALENDVVLSFYHCDKNTICFTNHWRKGDSQSYGPIYGIKHREFPETEDTYKVVEMKFTWQYFNTYDSKSGNIYLIYIGNTLKFNAEIVVLDTNEIISLKGYFGIIRYIYIPEAAKELFGKLFGTESFDNLIEIKRTKL